MGYFKAKMMFFSFEFNEVQDDVRHILQQHFSFSLDICLAEPILRQTKYVQQQKNLGTVWSSRLRRAEHTNLAEKALQIQ